MIERPEYIEKLKRYKDKNLIKVVTGIRRCGKTVLLFELYKNYLISIGVQEDHIICVNLENVKSESLRKPKELYDYIIAKRVDRAKYYVILEWLCQAFLFTKVYRYDIKGKSYLKTLNKYYATDMGLRNKKLNFRQLEPTHTLENIIFTELLRRGYRVDIGKNREKEIDFIATDMEETFYIQVAYSILDSNKKAQELSSFKDLDDGYRKIVITMDNDPFTQLEKGYKKINAIDFLLYEVSLS